MIGLVRMLGLAVVVAGSAIASGGHAAPAKPDFETACIPPEPTQFATLKQESAEQVVEFCTAALDAKPTDRWLLASYYNNRANAYMAMKKYKEALADLREAERYQPFNPIPFVNGALIHISLKEMDEALRDIDAAIRCDPHFGTAYVVRGEIYFYKHDYTRAMSDYDVAIREAPDYGTAYSTRCFARAVIGRDLPGAKRDCDEAVKLSPNDVNVLAHRGLVEYRMGEFDKAVRDCTVAIDKQHPGVVKSRPYFIRSLARAKLGDAAGAKADRDEALKHDQQIEALFAGVS